MGNPINLIRLAEPVFLLSEGVNKLIGILNMVVFPGGEAHLV